MEAALARVVAGSEALLPGKVAFLAQHAWGDRNRGRSPNLIPKDRPNEYSLAEIKHRLEVFLERLFHTSQFKRLVLPNGSKLGSGRELSPRADWRVPSDASAAVWLRELAQNVPDQ